MKNQTGCSTTLILLSPRSSSKKETLRNTFNPTWPNWHRHQHSDCISIVVYDISLCMSAASVYSIPLETSQRRVYRNSCCESSVVSCSPHPSTTGQNSKPLLDHSLNTLYSVHWATSQACDHVFQLKAALDHSSIPHPAMIVLWSAWGGIYVIGWWHPAQWGIMWHLQVFLNL